MSILSRALNFLGLRQKQNGGEGFPVGPGRVSGVAIFGSNDRIDKGQAMKQYTGWVYAALRARAQNVARIKWRLFRETGQGENKRVEEVEEHPLLNLLQAVNPSMTEYELKFTSEVHLGLVGNAYWMLFDGNGERLTRPEQQPEMLIPLNPEWVQVKRGHFPEFILGYEYKPGVNEKLDIEPWEVIHIKDPDPQDVHEGIGMVQAAAQWIDEENFAASYNREFFKNFAQLGKILQEDANLDQTYTEDQRKQILQQFDDLYSGAQRAYRNTFLPKGVDVKDDSKTQNELQFAETRSQARDRILAAAGVPKSRLGLVEDVNRANAEATSFMFAKDTVEPQMILITQYINEFLVPRFEDRSGRLFIDFESPIPEDQDREIERQKVDMAGQPILSVNEARQRYRNEDAVEGGDSITRPRGMTPAANATEPAERTVSRTGEGKPARRVKSAFSPDWYSDRKKYSDKFDDMAKKLAKIHRTNKAVKNKTLTKDLFEDMDDDTFEETVWKQFVSRVEEKTDQLREEMIRFNEEQKEEVLGNLPDAVDEGLNINGETIKQVDENELFDMDTNVQATVNLAAPIIQEIAEEEGPEAAALLGVELTADDIITDQRQESLDETVRKFAENYNETQAQGLKQSLEKVQAQGGNLNDMRDEVQNFYVRANQNRADMVARTESFRTANLSTKMAWQESGVVTEIKWFTASDERVDPFCRQLHGETVGIRENFFNEGDTFEIEDDEGQPRRMDLTYSDVGHPPLHPNCRCYTRPVVNV